jgi:CRP-like cAMP-binding protein/formate hydrogenlyase subunit 6/NADH:ubiquinone oxidoreductase subunit I
MAGHDTETRRPDMLDDGLVLPEEDGLFARDIDGQLVRMDKVTAADFEKQITIKIDGREVTVPKAVPQTDSQGRILRDAEGRPIPRATTIYDAATKAYAGDPAGNPVPILCHQEHLDPVGVCRVCCVEIAKVKRGSMQRERKLLPACHHRVEETMEVQTIRSPDLAARKRVDANVRTLVNLLAADHLPADWKAGLPANELGRLVEELDELALDARAIEAATDPAIDPAVIEAKWPLAGGQLFSRRALDRGRDDSSSRIAVDHNQCILCDRCVRACNEVKENHVIGRSGKGYATHIGFDLDDPMGSSSCVSCGECMISCPTGALVFRELVGAASPGGSDRPDIEELKRHPLFAGIPAKFLEWNSQSITRRRFRVGEVICHEGEYASTAFVLVRGRVGVSIGAAGAREATAAAGGFKAFVRSATSWLQGTASARPGRRLAKQKSVAIDSGRSLALVDGKWVGELTPADVLFGEMSCLNAYPRSATVVALEETEVLEIHRNVLYMLQRSESSRQVLDQAYRSRTLAQELSQLSMFRGLSEEDRRHSAEFLRDRAELVTVDKGQPIFRQGDVATDFYKVRFGFVKVSQRMGEHERVLDYLGPGRTFGEIGLISSMVDLDTELASSGGTRALRVATCTALDTVELVRIRGTDFREIVERYPAARDELVAEARRLLALNVDRSRQNDGGLEEFIGNGLYSAQKLLVLDLESCTRCDECTKACSDTHEGVTRLIREGLRFENFLVASSCRSCLDPYCLVGCPVDAIHRKPRENHPGAVEIVIEDHCIGCGLCSSNCPYGNISMHKDEEEDRRVATTCDLCRDLVGPDDDPSCVYACPHNAAFRMSGQELLQIVSSRHARVP